MDHSLLVSGKSQEQEGISDESLSYVSSDLYNLHERLLGRMVDNKRKAFPMNRSDGESLLRTLNAIMDRLEAVESKLEILMDHKHYHGGYSGGNTSSPNEEQS